MRIGRPTLLALGLVAALAACTEDATAPGKCPAFCPIGQIKVVDTILYVISRDSSYAGYVQPDSAQEMLAANAFGLDSRPIFTFGPVGTTTLLNPSSTKPDTTTVPYLSVDSADMILEIDRRDTLASNLTISLYRMPLNIDKTSTLGSLAVPFTDSLIRTMNVDSVFHLAGGVDSARGDSVARLDSGSIAIKVKIALDSIQARFIAADSGRSAFGIRISADSLALVSFTSVRGAGPVFRWWATFDSLGTKVHRVLGIGGNLFNSFVSNVQAPTLDSNLVVGGVPSARSLLRFAVPRGIRDSAQVIRATLYLFPVAGPVGLPGDSLRFSLARVSTDLGAKSPCIPDPVQVAQGDPSPSCVPVTKGDEAFVVGAAVGVGQTDTIAADITQIVRGWAGDTIAPQTLMLRGMPEGGDLVPLRFYSSRTTAFRPALHITYVPRFSFGNP